MPEAAGALTEAVFYILLSLHMPMHGYGIMRNVSALSDGRVSLGAGTLYGALGTLVKKGWIVPHGNQVSSRKKEYVITPLGKTAAATELQRLGELTANGKSIIGGESQ